MTIATKSTVKMLCIKGEHIRKEIALEIQKLFETYNDPKVSLSEKETVKKKLDKLIQTIEDRVTTRRLREAGAPVGPEPEE
jgi:hypothetical protein